jgi:hypothetical protein
MNKKITVLRAAVFLLLIFIAVRCGKGLDGECGSTIPSGATGAPSMTFYVGLSSASAGTAMTSTAQISGFIQAGGCGPFGVWENSNGGEVATEIEMRLNARLGVFAMAEGKVTKIQSSTQPFEAGEVEGVFVKYGENYTIKYAHVKDPVVSVGASITPGQKIGDTVQSSAGVYFWEAELRHKSG